MTNPGEALRLAIDRYIYENEQDRPRSHLGASIIGKECARAIWYSWRWFYTERHIGRMIRLFRRGHSEEQRFIDWLAMIGAVIRPVDHATGKQWLMSDFGGHFGGSCDGFISNLDWFGLPGEGICEFKTHKESSFNVLVKKGVALAKPSHYVQMQIYMGYFGKVWALYCAVNKNNDELRFEVVPFKPELFAMFRDRAWEILNAEVPPKKISTNSSFFVCKMCPAHDICHHRDEHAPPKNCRTCVNSVPNFVTGEWDCRRFGPGIARNFQEKGCDQWHARA